MQRAVAFARETDALAAKRAEDHPLGQALFDEELPQMWILNQLHVIGARPELDADTLVASLDDLYRRLPHRRVSLTDDDTGQRLEEGMRARGFRCERLAVMPLAEAPPPPPSGIAREAGEDEFRAVELVVTREDPVAAPVAELLVEGRARLRATRPETRAFLGRREGVDACTVTMHSDGRTAQLEDVSTLKEHRGQGLAGATLALAIHEALASGHDLVFLNVDADAGPVPLYERVGFRIGGYARTFTRV